MPIRRKRKFKLLIHRMCRAFLLYINQSCRWSYLHSKAGKRQTNIDSTSTILTCGICKKWAVLYQIVLFTFGGRRRCWFIFLDSRLKISLGKKAYKFRLIKLWFYFEPCASEHNSSFLHISSSIKYIANNHYYRYQCNSYRALYLPFLMF